jgi:superfamily I DNA/RNA helicase
MQGVDMPDLMLKLADYKEREMAKLIAADKGSQAQSVEDKVDTVIALADGLNEIQALETRIESVFSDDDEGVIFSSVHRSKGLEAKRVYLLRPDLMPHPMAKKDWEQVQERNIEYVAYTRSLEQLIFVAGEL